MKSRTAAVQCASNLRSIGAAAQIYAAEHQGDWPYFTYTMEPPQPTSTADTGGFYTISALRQEKWNGLGKLYAGRYIENYRAFFCPADTIENAKRESYDWTANTGWISASYVMRGYKQFSWQYLIAEGRNPVKTANLSRSAMVSCYFMTSPPAYPKIRYHEAGYPVLFGDGSVSLRAFPSHLASASNPPAVWPDRTLQSAFWNYFDQ